MSSHSVTNAPSVYHYIWIVYCISSHSVTPAPTVIPYIAYYCTHCPPRLGISSITAPDFNCGRRAKIILGSESCPILNGINDAGGWRGWLWRLDNCVADVDTGLADEEWGDSPHLNIYNNWGLPNWDIIPKERCTHDQKCILMMGVLSPARQLHRWCYRAAGLLLMSFCYCYCYCRTVLLLSKLPHRWCFCVTRQARHVRALNVYRGEGAP